MLFNLVTNYIGLIEKDYFALAFYEHSNVRVSPFSFKLTCKFIHVLEMAVHQKENQQTGQRLAMGVLIGVGYSAVRQYYINKCLGSNFMFRTRDN